MASDGPILDVSALLKQSESKNTAQPIVSADSLEIDVANMLALDYQERPSGVSLSDRARDCVQSLMAELFVLPAQPSALGPIVSLPPPTYRVPRAKPLPKDKGETKWEKFRKEKGIQKRKKSRMVYDEAADEYKPRWGKDRAGSSSEPWAIPHNEAKLAAAGASDPFELKKKERELRTQKQRKQEILNKRKEIVPLTGTQMLRRGRTYREKYEVDRAVTLAQKATASMGKFDRKLTKLKEPALKSKPKISGGGDLAKEKEFNTKVVDRVLKRQHDELKMDKLANQEIQATKAKRLKKKPRKK